MFPTELKEKARATHFSTLAGKKPVGFRGVAKDFDTT